MRKRSRGNSDGDIKRGERKRKAEQQEPVEEDSSQHINFFSDLKTGVCGLHVHNDANVHVCSLCTYIHIHSLYKVHVLFCIPYLHISHVLKCSCTCGLCSNVYSIHQSTYPLSYSIIIY